MESEMNENVEQPFESQSQPGPCPQPEQKFTGQQNGLQQTFLNIKLSTWIKCFVISLILSVTAVFIVPEFSTAQSGSPVQPRQQEAFNVSNETQEDMYDYSQYEDGWYDDYSEECQEDSSYDYYYDDYEDNWSDEYGYESQSDWEEDNWYNDYETEDSSYDYDEENWYDDYDYGTTEENWSSDDYETQDDWSYDYDSEDDWSYEYDSEEDSSDDYQYQENMYEYDYYYDD